MSEAPFGGFPGISRATAIPNVFFAAILPQMRDTAELLAFLWAVRLIQAQQGDVRYVTADLVWAAPGARESFDALGDGRAGLERGLARCAR